MKRAMTLFPVLLLCCALFSGCASAPAGSAPVTPQPPVQSIAADPNINQDFFTPAASYDDLYTLIQSSYGGGRWGLATEDSALAGGVSAASDGMSAPASDPGGKPASGTNIQVAGYDEADIVKTDGRYIYLLRDGELCIASVDGPTVTPLSTTRICQQETGIYEDDRQAYRYEWCQDMYLSGSRLVVLRIGNSSSGVMENMLWRYEYQEYTYADIYDVSDPAAPVRLASIGQEGSLHDSRLSGDTLYLVTNCYKYDTPVADDVRTFAPCLYDADASSPMPVGDIAICPEPGGSSYVVLSAISLEDLSRTGQAALYGSSCSGVYMNDSGIYLAMQSWQEKETVLPDESVYQVRAVTAGSVTGIARYDTADGGLHPSGSGVVEGALLNQFSMDEYQGYLRVVTTVDTTSYTVYRDEQFGFENYVWGDSSRSSSLYVLGENLAVAGAVTGLGQDEQVFSARFDGDVGYFVTFRQTDPLFAVDLSEPTRPTVMSALKIPGFSQYLHVYGEDLLLGIGMNADPDTGITQGMKLSMFDTGDKFNVTEAAVLSLDAGYAEALYDHHAVFIDTDKNLFGFAAGGRYLLFSYRDGGFVQLGAVPLRNDYGVRGLVAQEYLYIVEPEAVHVVSLADLSLLGTTDIPRG